MAEDYVTSARTGEMGAPDILTKRGGLFWGLVMVLVGGLWLLQVLEIIDLGAKFLDALLPVLIIIGGLYLLVMKVGR